MQIRSEIEEPTRELFGHALRAEYEDFARVLSKFPDDASLQDALRLTIAIAVYVATDKCGGRRPTDADLRKIAKTASEIETRIVLSEDEVYNYLAKVAFGGQALMEVLSAEDAGRLPFIVTSNLLGSTADVDAGQKWPDYLDVVEAALESATDPS